MMNFRLHWLSAVCLVVASMAANAQQPLEQSQPGVPPQVPAAAELRAAGQAFSSWLQAERSLSRQTICEQAGQHREKVEGDSLIFFPEPDRPNEPPSDGTIETTFTEYHLLVAVDVACHTNRFDVFDSRSLDRDASGQVAAPEEEDEYPDCTSGPKLLVTRTGFRVISRVLSALGHLDAVTFSCVRIDNDFDQASLGEIKLVASRVVVRNSRVGMLNLKDSTVDVLRIDGRRGVDLHDKSAEDNINRIDFLVLYGSTLKALDIRATAFSTIYVGSGVVDNVSISRSSAGILLMSNLTLKELILFQNDVGNLHLTDNQIAGELGVGFSKVAPKEGSTADRVPIEMLVFGPRPKWITAEGRYRPNVRVKNYVTLGGTSVGRDAFISVDLGRFDTTASHARSDGSVSLNLFRFSARNLTIGGSNIRLTHRASVVGTDILIKEDLRVVNSVLTREVDPTEGEDQGRPDPKMVASGMSTSRPPSAVLGFENLVARSLQLEQSKIDGHTLLAGAKLTKVSVTTFPSIDPDKYVETATGFCARIYDGDGATYRPLRGGGGVPYFRPWPLYTSRYPDCYGSIQIENSVIDRAIFVGLLTDVILFTSEIKSDITLGGRISGRISLTKGDAKDGTLTLGTVGQPLRWCEEGSLLLEGTRLRALFADSSSLLRVACDSDRHGGGQPEAFSPLSIGLRGAWIDQFLGLPRLHPEEPVNRGLLGLEADDIVAMASPTPEAPPLLERVKHAFGLGPQPSSSSDGRFDPEALARLSGQLRTNGYTSKATDLTIARIEGQRWNDGTRLDRVKWLLGLPIGWGYKLERSFIYATVFVLLGAWIAAYYRRYPALSPPGLSWKPQPVRDDRTFPEQRNEAILRILAFIVVCGAVYGIGVELPLWLQLTTDETRSILFGLAVLTAIGAVLAWLRKAREPWFSVRRAVMSLNQFGMHAIFFSLDRFLPAPGFHAHWGNYPRIGQGGRSYFYVHRFIGLVLFTITSAGLIGLFD